MTFVSVYLEAWQVPRAGVAWPVNAWLLELGGNRPVIRKPEGHFPGQLGASGQGRYCRSC